MPEISIVIPAYNAAEFLADAVASVTRQTFHSWELVIVDDGSTDGTRAVARACAARDPRVRVVWQANGGVATARNFGLSSAHPASRFVIFLDADDLWLPKTLETLYMSIITHPAAVASHGLARLTDIQGLPMDWRGAPTDWQSLSKDEKHPAELVHVSGDGIRPRLRQQGDEMVACRYDEPTTFAGLFRHCDLITPGMALLRRAALPPDPFDQSLSPCEDWDLWVRLSLRGDFAFANAVVIHYRKHGGNASGDMAKMRAAERAARRKWLNLPELRDGIFASSVSSGRRDEVRAIVEQYVWKSYRSDTTQSRRLSNSQLHEASKRLVQARWAQVPSLLTSAAKNYVSYFRLRHGYTTHQARCSYLATTSPPTTI